MNLQERVDERIWTLLKAAKDLLELTEHADLDELDCWDTRAQVQSMQTLLIEAMKPIDRKLTAQGQQSVRRGEYVIAVTRNERKQTGYKGGSSEALRHAVASKIADDLWGEELADDPPKMDTAVEAAIEVADELAKVWTQPGRSKLPSKTALAAFGFDVDDWIETKDVEKEEVKVWPVKMYESIIGPPPIEAVVGAGEPF